MAPALASAASLDMEEAPEIVEANARSSRLPRGQLAILALMRLSEPLAYWSVFNILPEVRSRVDTRI